MIFLTGDVHRFFMRIEEFTKHWSTTKEDVLIILGDAGINYYEDIRDTSLKDYLKELPITLFCVQGNHEARPEKIKTYREKTWHGGTVYVEGDYPSLLFAKDGEIYEFFGKKALVIGGAYSIDKHIRLMRGFKWFEYEQPSDKIKTYVETQLEKHNWKVDYVFSHTAPLKYEPTEVFIKSINQNTVDKTTERWLDRIEDSLDYSNWYCGHFHTEKVIDDKGKFVRFMYTDFIQLGCVYEEEESGK